MTDIPGRPTIYKGIRMRSRLEADYAGHIDRTAVAAGRGEDGNFTYEPEPCFAGSSGQWLADFLEMGAFDVYTELKPYGPLLELAESKGVRAAADKINSHLSRISVAWQTDPALILQLVFWEYEARVAPLRLMCTSEGLPWTAWQGDAAIPLLWPGNGSGNSGKQVAAPPDPSAVAALVRLARIQGITFRYGIKDDGVTVAAVAHPSFPSVHDWNEVSEIARNIKDTCLGLISFGQQAYAPCSVCREPAARRRDESLTLCAACE